jgi:hypothetical protein
MKLWFAAPLAVALASACPAQALAQSSSAHLKATFDLEFDCEQPFYVRAHPIHADFTGVLNADRSASADLVIRGLLFPNTVHFDARLGGAARPGPGGTTQLRVISRNRLRATWNLPNNSLVLDMVAHGNSCSTRLAVKLKPGKREYSMYDGHQFYYCSHQRLLHSTCQAR